MTNMHAVGRLARRAWGVALLPRPGTSHTGPSYRTNWSFPVPTRAQEASSAVYGIGARHAHVSASERPECLFHISQLINTQAAVDDVPNGREGGTSVLRGTRRRTVSPVRSTRRVSLTGTHASEPAKMRNASDTTAHHMRSGIVETTVPTANKHGVQRFTMICEESASRKRVTVEGLAPPVFPGERVAVSGTWVEDGTETATVTLTKHIALELLPASIKCSEQFFESEPTGQISKTTYSKLSALAVAENMSLLNILENHTRLITKMPGYGPVRSKKLLAAWETLKAERSIVLELMSSKLTVEHALRLMRSFSKKVASGTCGSWVDIVTALQKNPYLLVQSHVLDFSTADRIALNGGAALDSNERVVAALLQALQQVRHSGHCGIPVTEAVVSAENLLGIRLPSDRFDEILADNRIATTVVDGALCCFERTLFEAEREIAVNCARIASGHVPWEDVTDASNRIDAAATFRFGKQFALSESQRSALQTVLWSKFTVLTGGPGVGKTRILAVLMAALRPIGVRVLLAAPTGRAAARLREATGLKAVTLHRLLGMTSDGDVKHDESNQLACDLVVVDEASMIDVDLMQKLTAAIPPDAALLLVGDVDQLPSVGPGDVLVDLMRSQLPNIVHLTEIYRQGHDGTDLVTFSRRVRDGDILDMTNYEGVHGKVRFIPTSTLREATDAVLRVVTDVIPSELGIPRSDVQVLCPTRNFGSLSVTPLNQTLQKVLNVDNAHYRVRSTSGTLELRMDDKVMQMVNNSKKGVHNGDIGTVSFLNLVRKAVDVTFRGVHGDTRTVTYTLAELEANLALAYACTIHKSQGSEYDAVVLVLDMTHGIMLRRSLLYTALTRAKRLLYIVGSDTAFKTAVLNNDQPNLVGNELSSFKKPSCPRRWTSLGVLLRERTRGSKKPLPVSPLKHS